MNIRKEEKLSNVPLKVDVRWESYRRTPTSMPTMSPMSNEAVTRESLFIWAQSEQMDQKITDPLSSATRSGRQIWLRPTFTAFLYRNVIWEASHTSVPKN